jgi:hypothetical protein
VFFSALRNSDCGSDAFAANKSPNRDESVASVN